MAKCAFSELGGCDGRLVKAHLIPKQALKREVGWRRDDAYVQALNEVVWDPRCWRWMCGGPTGIAGHHGAYDWGKLKLAAVPEDLREFLREYDLEWMAEAYIERHIASPRA